jgi:hypothetical protein
MEPRSFSQRKADALALLRTPAIDGWVATASIGGDGIARAHLVPLSLAWLNDRLVLALAADSLTARNIAATGAARVAVGPTRNVVIADAVLERSVEVAKAPAELADGYAGQADWDPRTEREPYLFLVLRPERILAWREANEIAGRTLMRGGVWLDDLAGT